mmetsp:Transcript_70763/g.118344  ORF Transcript_70763/g.118344 Transcript_70763/m.118344 type:complete len:96 (-) Transcript_70763:677-964(-)
MGTAKKGCLQQVGHAELCLIYLLTTLPRCNDALREAGNARQCCRCEGNSAAAIAQPLLVVSDRDGKQDRYTGPEGHQKYIRQGFVQVPRGQTPVG